MAMSIVTNVGSLNAQRNLSKTGGALQKSLAQLSSGLRINRASDDAAGLAISENLKAQVRSLGQAERNANDGISLLQTAEGAMNEVQGIMGRMRELAVQASSDTLSDTERGYAQQEFSALMSEIDRIASVTEYNGTTLLDGSATGIEFQVGWCVTQPESVVEPAVAVLREHEIGVATVNEIDHRHAGLLAVTVLAATIAIACAGTLYATLAAGQRVRETLVPLLVLPVLAPVLLGATQATEAALFGPVSDGWPWAGLLSAFAVFYIAIGIVAFGSFLEES